MISSRRSVSGDDHAPDTHGLQAPHRSQFAGTAHLDVDRFQGGFRFFRGEFVRDPPSRGAAYLAKALLPVEAFDLINDTVDVIRKIGSRPLDRAIMVERFLDRVAALQEVADECRTTRSASSSSCIAANGSLTSPQPWARKRSGRAAVMPGSFCLSEPAAALRGLAKILPPAASCRSLRASKSALDMYTSPRTSTISGPSLIE